MIPAVVSAGGARLVRSLLNTRSLPTWNRRNFAGERTSLTGGLDVIAGLAAGLAAELVVSCPSGCASFGAANRAGVSRTAAGLAAASVATAGAAAGGYVDDHLEDRFPATGKGFRGHLGALREGRLTSGLVKIAATGTSALLASGLLSCGRHQRNADWLRRRGARLVGELALDSALICLTANAANLLDLRPGRTRKAAILAGVVCALNGDARALSGITVGAAAGGLPEDLRGSAMLGDLGANALGAHLGTAVAHLPVRHKVVALIALVALNGAAERVSLSELIDRTPALRTIDRMGREP